MFVISVLPRGWRLIAGAGAHHRLDRQVVLGRKFEITLVVCRYSHHCAVAVVHQHIVGYPDRQLFTGQWMLNEQRRRQALFLLGGHVGFGNATAFALSDERLQLRVVFGGLGGERVLSGDRHVSGAHQGVRAGGEHFECARFTNGVDVVRELHFHAAGLANPVALHGFDLFRPASQFVEAFEQLVCVGRDLEVVHRDFAFFDHRTRTPAAAVDHLLVGQNGLVYRVPVYGAVFTVNHTFFEQAREQPLFPAVVIRFAGGDFARPVNRQTQAAQLGFHVGDVFVGPLGRRDVVFHRGVFSRHAERIPAHWLKHVFAEHALVTGDHVTNGVVTHVPHV